MLAYNLTYPFSCNHNTRLWIPVLFPACMLLGQGYDDLARRRPSLRYVLGVFFFCFLAVLLWFYIEILLPFR